MSNKKNIKEQVRSDVTMLEELTKIKKDVETYKKVGEEMGEEICSLKRQNSGLKARNTVLNGEIKKLRERVEYYKSYAEEGDELNEKKVEKIEWLSNELNKSEENLEKSLKHAKTLLEKIATLEKQNATMRKTIESYKALPWYKRLFSCK